MSEDLLAEMLRKAGPRAGIPRGTEERLRAAARAALIRKRSGRRRAQGLRMLAAAASLVLLVWAVRTVPRQGTSGTPVVATVEYSTAAPEVSDRGDVVLDQEISTSEGQVLALRASTGHSIRLAPGTRARFTDMQSLELLAGAVFVDSGPDFNDDSGDSSSTAALSIQTPFGVVTELGTRYVVDVAESRLAVRVRGGSVEVESDSGRHRAEAGFQLTVGGDGAASLERTLPFGEGWEWVLDAAVAPEIDGRPLSVLLDWVVRETGWSLEFDDPQTAARAPEIVLRGSIEGLSPEDALAAILPTCALAHRVSSGKVIVGAIPED
jgi:ferric-dicitrate binding protein FerR (iron transport regulator)